MKKKLVVVQQQQQQKEKIVVAGSLFLCDHCGHVWKSKVELPKSCPKCKMYGKLSSL